ncbi:MAG: RDD family protein [Verrucomicrobiota bacterium]
MSRKPDTDEFLDQELKKMPEENAPDSLAAEVMDALSDRKPLVWYQRPYYTWGKGAKKRFDEVGSIDDSYVATGVAARKQYREIGNQADEVTFGKATHLYVFDEYDTIGAWDRAKATLVDALLFAGTSLATGWAAADSLIVWLGYHAASWSIMGRTVGGLAMGQRVERVGGGRITIGASIVRALSSVISAIPLGLGFIWASWDVGNQSWHDKIAGTVTMRTRRGR